ncbi:hypothetical protein [Geodermatophilus sp. URMC 63]
MLNALAGLMAGIIGAASVLFVTLLTTSSDDKRSRDEFTRTSRGTAYAEYLDTAQSAFNALRPYVPGSYYLNGQELPSDDPVYLDPKPLPPAPVLSESEITALSTHITEVATTHRKVGLLASADVVVAAQNITNSLSLAFEYLRHAYCTASTTERAAVCLNPPQSNSYVVESRDDETIVLQRESLRFNDTDYVAGELRDFDDRMASFMQEARTELDAD